MRPGHRGGAGLAAIVVLAVLLLPAAGPARTSPAAGMPATPHQLEVAPGMAVGPFQRTAEFGEGDATVFGHGSSRTFGVRAGDASVAANSSPPLVALLYEPTNPMNLGAGAFLGINASGGAPPYSYQWFGLPPGSPSVNASSHLLLEQPTTQGLYQVNATVLDSSGQQVNLTFAPLWIDGPLSYILLASPPAGILPLSVAFSAQSSFSGVTGVFRWDLGDGNTTSTLSPSHTYVLPGIYTVSLRVSYAGGSQAFASRTVSVVAPLALVGPSGQTVDLGSSIAVNSSVTGGVGTYNFSWSGLPPGCAASNRSEIDCTPSVAGTFSVRLSVGDPLGGARAANATVVVHPRLTLSAAVGSVTNASCDAHPPMATLQLQARASGGSPPYSISWSGPNGSVATGDAPAWSVVAPGAYRFNVSVTDGLGASAQAFVLASTGVAACGGTGTLSFWSTPAGSVTVVLGLLVVLVVGSAVVVAWRRRRR